MVTGFTVYFGVVHLVSYLSRFFVWWRSLLHVSTTRFNRVPLWCCNKPWTSLRAPRISLPRDGRKKVAWTHPTRSWLAPKASLPSDPWNPPRPNQLLPKHPNSTWPALCVEDFAQVFWAIRAFLGLGFLPLPCWKIWFGWYPMFCPVLVNFTFRCICQDPRSASAPGLLPMQSLQDESGPKGVFLDQRNHVLWDARETGSATPGSRNGPCGPQLKLALLLKTLPLAALYRDDGFVLPCNLVYYYCHFVMFLLGCDSVSARKKVNSSLHSLIVFI